MTDEEIEKAKAALALESWKWLDGMQGRHTNGFTVRVVGTDENGKPTEMVEDYTDFWRCE